VADLVFQLPLSGSLADEVLIVPKDEWLTVFQLPLSGSPFGAFFSVKVDVPFNSLSRDHGGGGRSPRPYPGARFQLPLSGSQAYKWNPPWVR